jgi:hypothetical protein
MDAKARYRLRQKLKAALLRVVEVVGELQQAGVDCNTDNLVTADAAMRILARFFHPEDAGPLMVVARGKEALLHAMERRLLETAKRKARARRSRCDGWGDSE